MSAKLSPALLALTGSIYTTQYIGVAFVMAAAVAILRQDGVSLDKLALLNLVALPLALKIFYAPFIDRYRLFFQGQYRSWLLVAQLIMAVALLIIGILDFKTQLMPILLILVVYAIAVALQDVAIDGLACKIFDSEQRQYANSLQFSGNLLGNIIGGGLLLMAYPWLSWRGALWTLAGLTTVSWAQLLCYQEPVSNSIAIAQGVRPLLKDCKDFIANNKRWFLLLLIYPLALSGAFATLNPLLVDAGWKLGDIGFALKVYGSLIGLLSALSASLFMQKWGRELTLSRLTIVLAVALAFLLPVTLGWATKFGVYLAITAYFSVFPALLATFGTMMMDKVSKSERRATMFTLQFSVISLMGFVYAGICMALSKFIGYEIVVIVGTVAAVGCYFFSRLLRD